MNYTISEAMDFIEENDVKFIRLAFCDIFGNHKNISIMPERLEQAFYDGIAFDCTQIAGYEREESLRLKPDPATLSVLPWRPQQGCVVRFYCDVMYPDKTICSLSARSFLKETLNQGREMGIFFRISLHSEFYLFRTDDDGNLTDEPLDQGGYLDVAPLDKGENIRREICLCLEEMGIQPDASYHESGPGQNEIDFHAADALRTADNFITYKNVVSNIAARNGLWASFAAKPIQGKSGNGLHLHILAKPTMDMHKYKQDLNQHFLAGVLNRMRDITAFLNTQEESYQRFGENEAPRFITWSNQNRSRLIRVMTKDGKSDGFVLRSPDSAINPYLAFAFIIQAGLEGVKNQEPLAPNCERGGDGVADDSQFEALPASLSESIECAKRSAFVSEGPFSGIAELFLEKLSTRK